MARENEGGENTYVQTGGNVYAKPGEGEAFRKMPNPPATVQQDVERFTQWCGARVWQAIKRALARHDAEWSEGCVIDGVHVTPDELNDKRCGPTAEIKPARIAYVLTVAEQFDDRTHKTLVSGFNRYLLELDEIINRRWHATNWSGLSVWGEHPVRVTHELVHAIRRDLGDRAPRWYLVVLTHSDAQSDEIEIDTHVANWVDTFRTKVNAAVRTAKARMEVR